ncbi:MAG: hypothetical protein AB8B69_08175 [Chitinophagales bacterium]
MSNPIKNDGGLGDRVPRIVKVKIRRKVTGEENDGGMLCDVVLELEAAVSDFHYTVILAFPISVELNSPTISGNEVKYSNIEMATPSSPGNVDTMFLSGAPPPNAFEHEPQNNVPYSVE